MGQIQKSFQLLLTKIPPYAKFENTLRAENTRPPCFKVSKLAEDAKESEDFNFVLPLPSHHPADLLKNQQNW